MEVDCNDRRHADKCPSSCLAFKAQTSAILDIHGFLGEVVATPRPARPPAGGKAVEVKTQRKLNNRSPLCAAEISCTGQGSCLPCAAQHRNRLHWPRQLPAMRGSCDPNDRPSARLWENGTRNTRYQDRRPAEASISYNTSEHPSTSGGAAEQMTRGS